MLLPPPDRAALSSFAARRNDIAMIPSRGVFSCCFLFVWSGREKRLSSDRGVARRRGARSDATCTRLRHTVGLP